jgi:hypothetical protein
MSRTIVVTIRVTVALVAVLAAPALMASTVVVGPTGCQPALVHFSDIQSAINASPQGGIVLVCPGVYSQQLSIFHPITIKGIDYDGSNMALITMPAGGGSAQIYVQATGVNLSDLTIDGTNNGGICGEGPYGIWYADSSGVINHVAIRNETPTANPGCFDGDGVVVTASSGNATSLTIENSTIHSFQGNGVLASGVNVNVTLKNNTIGGNNPGPAGNGVVYEYGASGKMTDNTIANVIEPVSYPNIDSAGFGILIFCSDGVTVSGNEIADTQVGLYISSGAGCTGGNGNSSTITKNTISQTHVFDAIYVCGNYNLVQKNIINSTSEAAINIDSSCNPGASGAYNNFSGNTVNEACMTALVNPAVFGANTIGSNSAFNDIYDLFYGEIPLTGACGAAPAVRKGNVAPGPNSDSPRLHPSVPSR